LKEKDLFSGKMGEQNELLWNLEDQHIYVQLIGLGTSETFNRKKYRKALGSAYKNLKKKKVSSVGIDLGCCLHLITCIQTLSRITSESLVLADYTFDLFKSDKKENTIKTIEVNQDSLNVQAFQEGLILGEATIGARKVNDLPANKLTPTTLSEFAKEEGKKFGFEVEVKGLKEIEMLEMDAFLAVSRGSSEEPKLIVMRYNGNPLTTKRLGLVGKGLTYDSGGLSIKPTASMVSMKNDMSGAGSVLFALSAIAANQLKVNVTAVIAACENMISGACYKPGDIIGSMGKKTIFIGNTDAEGRLTLIDAVTYIQRHEKVNQIVDIATLTGAAIHCLGTDATPIISNNDQLNQLVEKSFEKSDENCWRMPIFDEYKELLKHEYADYTNTAGSPGTITAGMLILEFIKDIPWVHIDIAGTANIEKDLGIYSKGATGVGVRPLYFLAQSLAGEEN
jgi:leucyl aminopeptidase